MGAPRKARGSKTDEGAQVTAPSSDVSKLASDMRAALRGGLGADALPDPLEQGHVTANSSGLLSVDLALGIGGWPRARVNYVAGPKASGKTTLVLQAAAQRQVENPNAIIGFLDVEQAYSESLAHVIGIDTNPERFIVVQPETAEQACMGAMMLMGYQSDDKGRIWTQKRPPVDMLIYDSWAGSATEEVGLATLARVGSQWWPKLTSTIRKTNTLFFVINQVRYKPGVMFGNPEYEPGGEALQHAISLRATVHAIQAEKDALNRQIAHTLKVYIGKNKVGAPHATAHPRFNYYTGFDLLSDAKSVLDIKGVSLKEREGGNILLFKDPDTGEELLRANGEKAFFDDLRTSPDIAEKFIDYAKAVIAGKIAA